MSEPISYSTGTNYLLIMLASLIGEQYFQFHLLAATLGISLAVSFSQPKSWRESSAIIIYGIILSMVAVEPITESLGMTSITSGQFIALLTGYFAYSTLKLISSIISGLTNMKPDQLLEFIKAVRKSK